MDLSPPEIDDWAHRLTGGTLKTDARVPHGDVVVGLGRPRHRAIVTVHPSPSTFFRDARLPDGV